MAADGSRGSMYRHVALAIEIAREVFRADLALISLRVVVMVFGMMTGGVASRSRTKMRR